MLVFECAVFSPRPVGFSLGKNRNSVSLYYKCQLEYLDRLLIRPSYSEIEPSHSTVI